MKTVLITGGAGFVGSHIVDLLAENSYNVAAVDNLSAGVKENINEKAVFYNVDILDEKKLDEVFSREKPDFVIHQAAQVSVRKSMEDPIFDARVNMIGSANVFLLCKKYKVKKVVYAGSGGARYGEPKYLPCDEKHPCSPISPYGVSKYAAEHLLRVFCSDAGIDYSALCYSNVYGPRQDPNGEAGVVAIFLNNMLDGKECIINGDGDQTRDFVYVKDVAKANLMALERNTKEKIFNIGAGKETSVNELFNAVKKLLGKDAKASHGAAIPGEVYRIYLDVKLAEKELGWKAGCELEKGLKETISWFKGKINK
ncbi:MAG: NAD-dependent epimerase/dehydratase family protein [Candidatus Woesearchaeota archaeon]|nr:NAD-dependent epimerase/dehydratase family protein [Candidatus Woesearchaeota archaeon]